jgi:hypothetical protein
MTLVDRVKNIILTPKTEWPLIDREPGDVAYLFTSYVAILAAIPAICGFIGLSVIGLSVTGMGTVRIGVATGLVNAIVGYLLSFLIIYVVALIVDSFAPTFGGRKNFESALKVTVYSYTPSYLCGIFLLVPGVRFLTILGLYGLYLLWLGLPPLMKSPKEKSLGYATAIVVCAIVIGIILGMIQGALFSLPRTM